MNKMTKLAVIAAAVALVGQAAYAQSQNPGDLLLGFGGTSQDYVVDLGSFSSLSTTAITHLGSDLSGLTLPSGVSTVGAIYGASPYAGAGDYDGLSLARTGSNAAGVQGTEASPVYNQNSQNISGNSVTLAASYLSELAVGSLTGNQPVNGQYSPGSFSEQAAVAAGLYGTSLYNSYLSSFNGTTAALDIFQVNRTADTVSGRRTTTHTSPWAYVGQLDIDLSSSTADFVPAGYVATAQAPEPTTYGLIAGAGLLALSLRRQFSRKNA